MTGAERISAVSDVIEKMTEKQVRKTLIKLLIEIADFSPCTLEEDFHCPCWDVCNNKYGETCEMVWLRYVREAGQ